MGFTSILAIILAVDIILAMILLITGIRAKKKGRIVVALLLFLVPIAAYFLLLTFITSM